MKVCIKGGKEEGKNQSLQSIKSSPHELGKGFWKGSSQGKSAKAGSKEARKGKKRKVAAALTF